MSPNNKRDDEQCNQVAEVIRQHPEGITKADIAQLVNLSYNRVDKILITLSFSHPLAEETVSRNKVKFFMIEDI